MSTLTKKWLCKNALINYIVTWTIGFGNKRLVRKNAHVQHNNFSSGCNVLNDWLAEKLLNIVFKECCPRSDVKIYINSFDVIFWKLFKNLKYNFKGQMTLFSRSIQEN